MPVADHPWWPSSLPFPLARSPGYQPLPNQIATQGDSGAPRARPRFTATASDSTLLVQLRPSQVQTLDDFYRVTLRGGGLPFVWYDFRRPITEQNRAVYRFKNEPPMAPNESGLYWIATLSLIRLTTADGRFLLDVSDANTGLTNT